MSNDVAVYEHSEYDGYDDAEVSDRVIQGSILKQIDGRTSVDGVPFPDTPLIAVDIKKIAQRWGNQIPLETIVHHPGEPLPNIDELNSRIPQSQWEPGLDGQPRPPWQMQIAVYLLDPATGEMFTFINSTTGHRIAVEHLVDQVKYMRGLRGNRIVPIVKVGAKPMKTKFGVKMRPAFTVIEWRDLSGSAQQIAPVDTAKQIGAPVKPITTAEIISDEIPF